MVRVDASLWTRKETLSMKRTVIFGLLFGLILLGARLLPHSPAEATIEPDNGLARPMSIEKLLEINNPGPGELYFRSLQGNPGVWR